MRRVFLPWSRRKHVEEKNQKLLGWETDTVSLLVSKNSHWLRSHWMKSQMPLPLALPIYLPVAALHLKTILFLIALRHSPQTLELWYSPGTYFGLTIPDGQQQFIAKGGCPVPSNYLQQGKIHKLQKGFWRTSMYHPLVLRQTRQIFWPCSVSRKYAGMLIHCWSEEQQGSTLLIRCATVESQCPSSICHSFGPSCPMQTGWVVKTPCSHSIYSLFKAALARYARVFCLILILDHRKSTEGLICQTIVLLPRELKVSWYWQLMWLQNHAASICRTTGSFSKPCWYHFKCSCPPSVAKPTGTWQWQKINLQVCHLTRQHTFSVHFQTFTSSRVKMWHLSYATRKPPDTMAPSMLICQPFCQVPMYYGPRRHGRFYWNTAKQSYITSCFSENLHAYHSTPLHFLPIVRLPSVKSQGIRSTCSWCAAFLRLVCTCSVLVLCIIRHSVPERTSWTSALAMAGDSHAHKCLNSEEGVCKWNVASPVIW